jgi:xanthosine utilization system XapX-like protein
LFGMLVGEQAVPIAKRLISGEPVTVSWFRACGTWPNATWRCP